MVKGLIDALKGTEIDIVLTSNSEGMAGKVDCGNCLVQLIEKTDKEGYRKTFLIGVCTICCEVCFVSDPPAKEDDLDQYEREIKEKPSYLTEFAKENCKCHRKCRHGPPGIRTIQ